MRTLLRILMVLAAGSGLLAETYEHRDGGVSIWFPDNWNVNIDEDALSASSINHDAAIEVTSVAGAANLDAARERCQARLAARVRQWEETEASHAVSLGGMESIAFGGLGVQGGAKKSVRVLVIKAPKRYVIVLWSADRAVAPRFQATYDRIVGSIRPVRS